MIDCKYIQKKGDKFLIQKDKEYYGSFDNLKEALLERDLLVSVDWDIEEAIFHDYVSDYPDDVEFDKVQYVVKDEDYYVVRKGNKRYGKFTNLEEAVQMVKENDWEKDTPEYIYLDKRNGKYAIRKSIKGKTKRFGMYRTIEEAIKWRDLLIENDWCKLSELKRRLRENEY